MGDTIADKDEGGRSAGEVAGKPEKPEKSRVLRYDEVFDLRTNQYRLIKSAKPDVKKHKSRRPVLTVRRIVDYKGRHTDTQVDVHSALVAGVLNEINDEVEGLSLRKNPPVAHPHLFFHNREELAERLKAVKTRIETGQTAEPSSLDKGEGGDDDNDEALAADLQVAVDFVQEEHSEALDNTTSLFAAGETTWALLWALFPPNQLVYHWHELTEQHQILLFRRMQMRSRPNGTPYWSFACDVVVDDGAAFGLAKEPLALEIDLFDGSRKIRDLLLYPLDRRPDAARLRQDALARGRAYAAISRPACFQTSGPAMFEKRDARYVPHPYKFTTHGRAMADAAAFRSFNPNIDFLPAVHRTLERDHLTEQQLIICTPVVLGFSFGDKKWGGLGMSRLRPIEWNSQAFETLVLDKEPKMLIRALVQQHALGDANPENDEDAFDDIISGKGRGLIGMLSGPPGSGKTLTAEAVAEVTRRPLYAVSAGELGVEPDKVDERLSLILELAHRWNAVLLLDEADVFLQARSTADVNRNALVSIFLRQLEYYQGILILTTNRLAQCDPAFDSRIHITIAYPELNTAARRQVWQTFLARATRTTDAETMAITPADIDHLAEHAVNGRQIKNIVSGARALARELGEPLGMSHIEMVLAVMGSREKHEIQG